MKIISKKQDYYDYVASMYGGGDDRNTYNRNGVIKNRVEFLSRQYADINWFDKSIVLPRPFKCSAEETANFSFLVVCGKAYLCYSMSFQDKHIIYNYDNELIGNHVKDNIYCWHNKPFINGNEFLKEKYQKEDSIWDKVSIELGEPIFLVNGVNVTAGKVKFHIMDSVPNLSERGFSKIMSPERCYQEIALYRSNVLKLCDNESNMVQLSDTDRLEKSGFDKKTSFRHRK